MSDAGGGLAAITEGDHADAKDLERLNMEKLEGLQKRKMEQRIAKAKQVLAERAQLRKSEDEVNKTNEELVQRKQELEQLRSQNKVELSGEHKGLVERVTGEVISKFIVRKRRSEISQTTIDVRYLPGQANACSDIRIGGEGAGSLLARFEVQLDKQVSDLAVQAAKYWGLDNEKVFFLDRNYRIVPDSMTINEILFPGDAQATSSSSTAPGKGAGQLALSGGQAGGSPGRGSTSSALEKHSGGGSASVDGGLHDSDLVPVLEGRNYVLTLVRAGTVLDMEDLTAPRGKAWDDFTFEQKKLEQELDNTRKKYGDTEKVLDRVSLDDIPSLFELRALGLKRTYMRRWDTRCRIFEFVVFFVSQILFFASVSFASGDVLYMRLISEAVEETYLHLHHFRSISNVEEYDAYLRGTFKDAVVDPAMNNSNLFVLGTLGYMYEGVEALNVAGICGQQPTDENENGTGNDSNETANGTANVTADATARLLYGEPSSGEGLLDGEDLEEDAYDRWVRQLQDLTVDNSSNLTDGTEGNETDVCTPESLKRCPNERVIDIFKSAMSRGHQYPVCEPVNSKWDVTAFIEALQTPVPFSHIMGEVTVYPVGIPFEIDTHTEEGYDATIEEFARDVDAEGNLMSHAKLIVLIVYSPDLNAVLIFQLLTEHTLSGVLINTVKKVLVPLMPIGDSELTLVVFVLILSLVVLLCEIRRILGCPRRCFYEREMDRFTIWTIPFLMTPLLMIGILALQVALDTNDAESVLLLGEDGHITNEGINNLFDYTMLMSWHMSLTMSVLVLHNLTLWRYILSFFPQLSYTSKMFGKVSKFLFFVFVYIVLAFVSFGLFMGAVYGSTFYEFHNVGLCLVNTIRMLLGGGFVRWHAMYRFNPAMWTFIMLAFFIVFMLFLNNIAIAVLFSHNKEKELHESAENSAFWAKAKSEMTKSLEALKVGDRIRVSRSGIGPWKPAKITKVIEREGGQKDEYEAKVSGFWKRPEKWEYYERIEEFNPAKGGHDFTDIKNPKPPPKPLGL